MVYQIVPYQFGSLQQPMQNHHPHHQQQQHIPPGQHPQVQIQQPGNVKFNGSIQIEMKNASNGMRTGVANPSNNLNCRTQLNQNFSNNQDHTIPITVQVKPNGSEKEAKNGNATQPPPPPTPPPTKIPQLDGMDDEGEAPPPPQTTAPPPTRPKPIKQAPLVLQLGSSGQMKKKEKDQLRIGISGSENRTPRNISPKPKDSSPKQTIVATAKVTKPSSPGSSCSPSSRPIRVSPSHSSNIRGVNHSPIRAISPSRISNSGGSGSGQQQSGQPTYRLHTVNQDQLAKMVGRPNVTILVNGIKMPAQSQIIPSSTPSDGGSATNPSSASASSLSTAEQVSAKKASAVLLRDQTLLLQDEIDKELAEQNKGKPEGANSSTDPPSSSESGGGGLESIELVNQNLPPPPPPNLDNIDPDQPIDHNKMREVHSAKLKLLQKLKQIDPSQISNNTPNPKNKQPQRKQNAQIRKKVEGGGVGGPAVSKSVTATSASTSIAPSGGQSVISISGRPMLANPVRIKGAQQQIIIQSTTSDGQKLSHFCLSGKKTEI